MSARDNLINGHWTQGKSYAPNINPSNLADVFAAVSTATVAFPAWSTSGIEARSDALDKMGSEILALKDELGELLAREKGKLRTDAIGEVMRPGQILKFFVDECPRPSGEVLPA